MNRYVIAFALGVTATPALAGTVDDGFCRNGGFPTEQHAFGLALVGGEGHLYFLDDRDGCPNDQQHCRTGSYVIPGDRVVKGRTRGDYICTYFPSTGGGTAGWIAKSRLRPGRVDADPPIASWVGRWSDEGNPSVQITARGGVLQVSGASFWPGLTPSKDWAPGWPHEGSIEGKLRLRGNRAHYADEECTVDFSLLGDLLVVDDNNMCGGMNVSFRGVYRRL